jgi:hypothetical protein
VPPAASVANVQPLCWEEYSQLQTPPQFCLHRGCSDTGGSSQPLEIISSRFQARNPTSWSKPGP